MVLKKIDALDNSDSEVDLTILRDDSKSQKSEIIAPIQEEEGDEMKEAKSEQKLPNLLLKTINSETSLSLPTEPSPLSLDKSFRQLKKYNDLETFPGLRSRKDYASPSGFVEKLTMSSAELELRKASMLKWVSGKNCIAKSLTKLSRSSADWTESMLNEKCINCFKSLQGIMKDRSFVSTAIPALLKEFVTNGTYILEIRDELYCQIMKQLTENPRFLSRREGWKVLCEVIRRFGPSSTLLPYVACFTTKHLKPDYETDSDVLQIASDAFKGLTSFAQQVPASLFEEKPRVYTPSDVSLASTAALISPKDPPKFHFEAPDGTLFSLPISESPDALFLNLKRKMRLTETLNYEFGIFVGPKYVLPSELHNLAPCLRVDTLKVKIAFTGLPFELSSEKMSNWMLFCDVGRDIMEMQYFGDDQDRQAMAEAAFRKAFYSFMKSNPDVNCPYRVPERSKSIEKAIQKSMRKVPDSFGISDFLTSKVIEIPFLKALFFPVSQSQCSFYPAILDLAVNSRGLFLVTKTKVYFQYPVFSVMKEICSSYTFEDVLGMDSSTKSLSLHLRNSARECEEDLKLYCDQVSCLPLPCFLLHHRLKRLGSACNNARS